MDETAEHSKKQQGNAGASAAKAAASPKPGSREARLAEALRQNLKRRKSAARNRAGREVADVADSADKAVPDDAPDTQSDSGGG
ncbi:MAG: hypothetical protein ACK4NV_01075 [Pannonibacter sp.]